MEYKTIKELDKAIHKWVSTEEKNLKHSIAFYEHLITSSMDKLMDNSMLSKALLSRSKCTSGK
jgi:hypothetical protein